MPLYKSKIINEIFEKLGKENKKIIVDAINSKEIYSFEFLECVKMQALFLQKNWFKKWNLAVIFLKNSVDFAKIVVSVILAWGKVAIIDPEMWEKVIEEKLKFLKPDFLFIEWILYDILKFEKVRKILKRKIKNIPSSLIKIPKNIIINWFSLTWKWILKLDNHKNINEEVIFEEIEEETDAIIVFTGWTTSSPKWVVHSLSSINNMLEKIKDLVWNSKIFYADLPHFLLLWLISNSLVISSRNDIDDKKFKNILDKYKVDTIFSPPSKFMSFIEKKENLPKTLKKILLWSAPIYKSFLIKLKSITNAETLCIYWMTEILPVSFISWEEKIKKEVSWDLLWKIIHWIEYKIVEDELLLKWNNLFKNYLWETKEEWHKTWDLVKIEDMSLNNVEGIKKEEFCMKKSKILTSCTKVQWVNCWLLNAKDDFFIPSLIMIWRKKDMIIRGDYNIYPSIYEPIISWIPWVRNCALIWIYDEKIEDEKVILFIEIEYSNSYYDTNYIKKHLESWEFSIDKYAFPDDIIFYPIPKTWRQNKTDKNKLKEIYLNNFKKWKLQ
jgi:acyl-coenzyme A synthetase/AMP-(fatty) acid ligase